MGAAPVGAAEKGSGRGDAPASAVVSSHPAASRKRIALAVLLDFFVLSVPYAFLRTAFASGDGGGGPPGGGVVVFALVEFCLLQFLRRSPGYWLLGMSAALGDVPRVDPERLGRESLLTHVAGVLFLRSGIDGSMAWATVATPIPYFGWALGPFLSGFLSLLVGVAFIATAVLTFRNDLRGVWVGVGATAFSFLSVWFARGPELAGWVAAELTAQRVAQGRDPAPGEVEAVVAFVEPFVIVAPLVYGVVLYFCWKKLRPPAPPEGIPAG